VTRINGVVIGIVSDVDDPLGEGRVRVQFPWLGEDAPSGWAPIARTMAGRRRGFWYVPEVGDEALLAFELGDFDHPFVVGFLHNGVDTPPDDGIDREVRRMRTVSGHVLEFDDRAGRERVQLRTQNGHQLEMKDDAGTVEVRTAGGQRVLLRDSPAQIVLSTTAGTTVTISNAGGVSISAPTGALEVSCIDATVTAASTCTVTAGTSCAVTAGTMCTVDAPVLSITGAAVSVDSAITSFSGVVQCQALVTNAVASAAYTPGAGNIW
jgi:phage baseplate assembly protein gpV